MNDDPREKLIELINQRLKSGLTDAEVVNELVTVGMDEETAHAIVAQLRKRPYKELLTFIFAGIFIGFLCFIALYYFYENLIPASLTWFIFGVFLFCFVLSVNLTRFSGKTLAFIRLCLNYISAIGACSLSLALYSHSPWQKFLDIPGSGRWGVILNLVHEGFYFIGPKGWGTLMIVISIFTFFMSWGLYKSFSQRDYGSID